MGRLIRFINWIVNEFTVYEFEIVLMVCNQMKNKWSFRRDVSGLLFKCSPTKLHNLVAYCSTEGTLTEPLQFM